VRCNVGKTIVSGVSHKQTHAPGGITHKSAYNQVARQLTGRIKVQEPVTYQDPREPFTLPGVVLTMTRLAPAACNRREARENLSACEGRATPRSWIWCAAASSPPSRTHWGHAMHAHRHQDDGRAITTAIKRAYGLPTSTTAFTHEDTDKWGMGMPSLAVEYATRNTTLF
jgi:hypothetical protein